MIYYSHVNEDNRVERRLLAASPCTDLWCIAGSGERLIALLDAPQLRRVYAVDNNPEALYLLELKLAALQHLPVTDYLAFIGLHAMAPATRSLRYRELRRTVSTSCRQYWDDRNGAIRRGLLHCGHFERFLGRIRPLLRLYFTGYDFTGADPTDRQADFPRRRWAWLMQLFRYRWVYRLLGNRDPAFVALDADRSLIPTALQRLVDHGTARQSFFFHLIFRGDLRDMPREQWPPSLQPTVLRRIQNRLRQRDLDIQFRAGDLLAVCRQEELPATGPLFFSLSDLLSFVDFDYIQELCRTVETAAPQPVLYVLRAFLRNHLPAEQRDWLEDTYSTLADLSAAENTAMYRIYTFTHEPSLLPHRSLPA